MRTTYICMYNTDYLNLYKISNQFIYPFIELGVQI